MTHKTPARRTRLPCPFGADLPAAQRQPIERWWSALPAHEKRHLLDLSHLRPQPGPRRAATPNTAFHRHGAPSRVRGVPIERSGDEDNPFPLDLYEYVIAHEIILIEERTFHVCSQHPAARAVLRSGHLPSSFQCPLGRLQCPMRRILSHTGGQAVRLVALV